MIEPGTLVTTMTGTTRMWSRVSDFDADAVVETYWTSTLLMVVGGPHPDDAEMVLALSSTPKVGWIYVGNVVRLPDVNHRIAGADER